MQSRPHRGHRGRRGHRVGAFYPPSSRESHSPSLLRSFRINEFMYLAFSSYFGRAAAATSAFLPAAPSTLALSAKISFFLSLPPFSCDACEKVEGASTKKTPASSSTQRAWTWRAIYPFQTGST